MPAAAHFAAFAQLHRLHIQPPADAEIALAFVAAVVDTGDGNRHTGHRHADILERQREVADFLLARHLHAEFALRLVIATIPYRQPQCVLVVEQQGRVERAEHAIGDGGIAGLEHGELVLAHRRQGQLVLEEVGIAGGAGDVRGCGDGGIADRRGNGGIGRRDIAGSGGFHRQRDRAGDTAFFRADEGLPFGKRRHHATGVNRGHRRRCASPGRTAQALAGAVVQNRERAECQGFARQQQRAFGQHLNGGEFRRGRAAGNHQVDRAAFGKLDACCRDSG